MKLTPSISSGNLKEEEGAAERTVEDVFVRRFMFGTFHNCLANEIVIKRRGNLMLVCALMLHKMPPQKFYFLIGYTEELLSHFYKCPVKLEIQTLGQKAVYKYLWGSTTGHEDLKEGTYNQQKLYTTDVVMSFELFLAASQSSVVQKPVSHPIIQWE